MMCYLTGTAAKEAINTVEQSGTQPAKYVLVEALDRQEKGQGELSARTELESQFDIKVLSIISLDTLIDYIDSDRTLDASLSAHETIDKSGKLMFTGIVETVGTIEKLEQQDDIWILEIAVDADFSNDLKQGASVSVNGGICLTFIDTPSNLLRFDVVKETYDRTNLAFLKEVIL